MGKKRVIDSDIRLSETIAKMTYRQRDLWHGLIACADDQGRLPGNPAAIRALIWPYDDVSINDTENDIKFLATDEIGCILLYSVGNRNYIQIINWWEYQKGQWMGQSNYPAPDGWVDRIRVTGKGRKVITENWDTPGGFCLTFNDNDNDNDKDNVNDNPLSKGADKGAHKGADKGLSEDGIYKQLLTAFINKSKLPLLGNIRPRDNEALLKMVDANCQPEDIESAIEYSTRNNLQITGPASILNGTMIAMSNRKRNAEAQPSSSKEVWSEEHY